MQKGKGAFWEQQSSPLELAQVWELRGIRERRSLYWVPESHAEQLGLHPGSLWGQKSAALGDQAGHSVKSRNGTRKEGVCLIGSCGDGSSERRSWPDPGRWHQR